MFRILLALLIATPSFAESKVSFDRIVVIGASVSRGFTETEPLGGEKSDKLRFDRFLDHAIAAPHGRIVNDSNHLFFLSAEREAGLQLDRLARRDPTLVVAIDFLFWFLYGYTDQAGNRLELFDRGLAQLSEIDVPLVVGDIPDVSAAIGNMLSTPMVPSAEIRREANRRLAAWAEKKGNVSIVRLSEFVASSQSNAAINVGKLDLEEGTTHGLLQPDRLHPTPEGCAALALAVMAALIDDGIPEDQITWDPGIVSARAVPLAE